MEEGLKKYRAGRRNLNKGVGLTVGGIMLNSPLFGFLTGEIDLEQAGIAKENGYCTF